MVNALRSSFTTNQLYAQAVPGVASGSTASVVDQLERIYRSAPASRPPPGAGGAGIFRNVVILVAPLLQSFAGQSRNQQLAESDLMALGANPERIGRVWSQGQKDYFVNMTALLRDRLDRGQISRDAYRSGVREIFHRANQATPENEKIAIYEDLLRNSSDPATRAYAQRWLDRLRTETGGQPPAGRPPVGTGGNACPADWVNGQINDGRHRLQALRSVLSRHGDFNVPIQVSRVNRQGRRELIECEVPLSELLQRRVADGGSDMAGRTPTGRNLRDMNPNEVRELLRQVPITVTVP